MFSSQPSELPQILPEKSGKPQPPCIGRVLNISGTSHHQNPSLNILTFWGCSPRNQESGRIGTNIFPWTPCFYWGKLQKHIFQFKVQKCKSSNTFYAWNLTLRSAISLNIHTGKIKQKYLDQLANTTDYGRPMKPFFIEIQNFWAWADKLDISGAFSAKL